MCIRGHYCLRMTRQNEGNSECGCGSVQGSQTIPCALEERESQKHCLGRPGPAGRWRGDSSVSCQFEFHDDASSATQFEFHNDASSATLVSCAQAPASTLTSLGHSVPVNRSRHSPARLRWFLGYKYSPILLCSFPKFYFFHPHFRSHLRLLYIFRYVVSHGDSSSLYAGFHHDVQHPCIGFLPLLEIYLHYPKPSFRTFFLRRPSW